MSETKVVESEKRIKRGGRTKGTPNKTTALLKDAILEAAHKAGNKAGMVGYLTQQATENPAAFMTLLGKVMPLQVEGPEGKPVLAGLVVTIVDPSRN
jgi:hypothetical protein